MAKQSVKDQREELERIYSPPPPLQLIYKIFLFGTIGTFLAVLTVRVVSPNKLPQLTFQQAINRGQNNDQFQR